MKTVYNIEQIPEEAREAWLNYLKAEEQSRSWRWKDYSEKERWEAEEREARHNIIPWVGMGCTEILYSDRRACTVTEVHRTRKGEIKKVVVRENETVCKDWYASDYEIKQELTNHEEVFTKRSNGLWVMEGQQSRDGVLLSLGFRHHFIDPSF
jgi:hypothetical protein